MAELLEFEEPVGVLLKEIEALSMLPSTPARDRSIESLRRRADEIRGELFKNLTPWQRVLVARHPNRPNTLDYVERLGEKCKSVLLSFYYFQQPLTHIAEVQGYRSVRSATVQKFKCLERLRQSVRAVFATETSVY